MFLGVLVALPCLASAAMSCSTAAISSLLPSGAKVNSVTLVPAHGTYGQGIVADPEFPTNTTNVPELCAVYVNVVSSSVSSYNFGLFLPSQWNSRFLATGNGGFGGGIAWPEMGYFTQYGFAAMSTDTGHLAVAFDGSWALNNSEAVTDWGYRAMHGSVVIAKQITQAYYDAKPKYNYYSGCSTGGRQGLKEAQMFPDDFDGILAGAPAWWTTHLQPWSLEVGLYNLPADGPGHISADLMVGPVTAEIYRQCDPQDGLTDGIISDPYSCNFFPEALLCTRPGQADCLTPPQLSTLYHLYNDWVETNQTFVFPHFALGSEAQNTFLFNVSSAPSPAGTAWVANFLYQNPNWDWHDFTYATVQYADAVNPGMANADDFDMSPFFRKGGKLIQYHGLTDGLIATGSSIYFYKRVLQTLAAAHGLTKADLDASYRFFLVPGMQHCAGNPPGVDAPWVFGGVDQTSALMSNKSYSVPGYEDDRHDALLALMSWVEEGKAPSQIVATKFVNDTVSLGVQRQRPLCLYPAQATYSGSGDVDVASSWECKLPY
jgi:feruloyl esterase